MIKKSLLRISIPIKSLDIVENSKFLCRIHAKDGRLFYLMRGDRITVIRRKRVIRPR